MSRLVVLLLFWVFGVAKSGDVAVAASVAAAVNVGIQFTFFI